MTGIVAELRCALRLLTRHPGFSAAFVTTMALGVGGLTALFALVHGVLLRPLPYPDSRELAFFHWTGPEGAAHASSGAKLAFWQDGSRAFEGIAAADLQSAGSTLAGSDRAEYVRSLGISAGFFRTLGITPVLGREILPSEDRGGTCALVLSEGLWKRAFGGRQEVIGRPVSLNERPCTVVGVAPAGFRWQPEADLWLPLQAAAEGKANVYAMFGRLARDKTLREAQSESDRLFQIFRRESPAAIPEETAARLAPLKEWVVGDVGDDLSLLFGAGALVFLICCLNLSSFVTARSLARRRETAVCVALGARWRPVLHQALAEVSVVTLLGTLIGWGFARLLVPALLRLHPEGLPRAGEVRVGLVEILFAALAAFLAIAVIAFIPAFRMARSEVQAWLRPAVGGHLADPGLGGRRLGRLLVAGQVALSLAVATGAWALAEGLLRLRAVDPGFSVEDVWTLEVPLSTQRHATAGEAWRFSSRLRERLRALPGVRAVATASSLPLAAGLNVPAEIDGTSEAGTAVEYRAVSPEYFECLRIPILRGRSFLATDGPHAEPVVVVNQAFMERFLAGEGGLDRSVWIARGLGALSDRPRRIVGVVGNVRDTALAAGPAPVIYVPEAQVPDGLAQVIHQAFPLAGLVRFADSGGRPPDLRRVVAEIDPAVTVATLRPMRDVVDGSIVRDRFYTDLALLSGILAILLTAMGIYGVTGQQVGQRSHEIGVRMAVGARVESILTMVLGESLRLSILGIAIGVPLALGLHQLLRGVVYGAGAHDLLGLLPLTLLLGTVSLLATLPSARRATRVDPTLLLR